MKDVFQKPADLYEPRGRLDPEGFERHVSFQTFAPPEDLAPFVAHLWVIEWNVQGEPYLSEEVMHRPYVDVFLAGAKSGIQGTFRGKRTYLASGVGRIVGARLRPGAFRAFWDGEIADLQDQILALPLVFPSADPAFVERVSAMEDPAAIDEVVALLRSKHPRKDEQIEVIDEIIRAIETDASLLTVSDVAKAFARSERWLQQLFRDYLGIGLKWLLQRHRLLVAAEQIRENEAPNWAEIAYDLGYSSQSHFITDFKEVLGVTPLDYRKNLHPPDGK